MSLANDLFAPEAAEAVDAADRAAKGRLLGTVAFRLADLLEAGEVLDRKTLTRELEDVFGCSDASGVWNLRDAYDAAEAAQAVLIHQSRAAFATTDLQAAAIAAENLAATVATHRVRTLEQIDLQQFSTPAALSFVAAAAASPLSTDHFLEPSAGTGLLAAPVAARCASVILNEFDPKRAEILGSVFKCPVHSIDAATISLIGAGAPTLTIMNPPFSRTAGGIEDRHAGARHLLAALKHLAPGGRLVAIMPGWFAEGMSGRAGRQAVERIDRPVLDLSMPGGAFAKHGTSVDTRLLVFDKGSGANTVAVTADTLAAAFDAVASLPARQTISAARPAVPTPAPVARSAGPSFLERLAKSSVAARARPAIEAIPAANYSGDRLTYEVLTEPMPAADPEGHYVPYRVARLKVHGGKAHPDQLVESIAMASCAPPVPSYQPNLPASIVNHLSEAQIETIIYAGESHSLDLPGRYVVVDDGAEIKPDPAGKAYRTGYFLADGTGAGKGRQVAGVILDNWLAGRRRALWISKSTPLIEDARRDWTALGGLESDIRPLDDWAPGTPITMEQGILFCTYATLRTAFQDKPSRLAQIVAWLGEEFEGVIAFDEAHEMQNAVPGKSERGDVAPSQQGLAGYRLQNLLPRARILYVSATGATKPEALGYAARLGLWGEGAGFPDRISFLSGIAMSGMAGMEVIVRDLKTLGRYCARALSFAGVEYDLLEHRLTSDQVATYNRYATFWGLVSQRLRETLINLNIRNPMGGDNLNGQALAAAHSRFESVKQRFFEALLLSLKLPTLLRRMEQSLEAGEAPVVQLVTTAESVLNRRLADWDGTGDIDMSPRDYILDYLRNGWPINQFAVKSDEEGNLRSELMIDSEGHPVVNPEAESTREDLILELAMLPGIDTLLDAILRHFGHDNVAEVTGRSKRMIWVKGEPTLESRPGSANIAETNAFMDGKKMILVFSDAGGTGRSYHADLSRLNQARRRHFVPQPGWRADGAVQGLGRSHRTNQACPPIFSPVSTNVRGERRFISTIARRLDALGALTRGQRQTGGQGLFNPADNLESGPAQESLRKWFELLVSGKAKAITVDDFEERTGLKLRDSNSRGLLDDTPPISRFLNRLLALDIGTQNRIFAEFQGLIEARVDALRKAGKLDLGVETIRASRMTLAESYLVRKDERTGAETRLLTIDLHYKRRAHALADMEQLARGGYVEPRYVLNTRSGRVAIVADMREQLAWDGSLVWRGRLLRPSGSQPVSPVELEESSWEDVDRDAFSEAWAKEVAEIEASETTQTVNVVTGLLLPVWGMLPGGNCVVWRIEAPNEQPILGRIVEPEDLATLANTFGIGDSVRVTPEMLARIVARRGVRAALPVPGKVGVRRVVVNDSHRLEIDGLVHSQIDMVKRIGGWAEVMASKARVFIPVDNPVERLADLIEALGGTVDRAPTVEPELGQAA